MSAAVCTLRAAIHETNALPGADFVVVPHESYVLAGSSATRTRRWPTTSTSWTISLEGRGMGFLPRITAFDGGPPIVSRMFDVFAPAHVEIRSLNISGGTTFGGLEGGAVRNAGELALYGCALRGIARAESTVRSA